MDAPSGNTFARVTDGVTPHFPMLREVLGRTVVLMTGLALLAAPQLAAQEEIQAEPALMARLAPQSLLLDVALAGGSMVAVGERGHILVSADGGQTWKQSPSPTRTMLNGVFFIDDMNGWAVGHDSAILRSSDGGASWEIVNWAPEDEAPLFDVWFADAENGVAIGAYGTFLVTSDGGEFWDFQSVEDTDWHLHSIRPAGDGVLYIAGEAGTAFRSDDGGLTWQELPSPYEGSFFGVLPLEGDSVLLFGLRGHLFRSDDGGQTWQELETGTVAMLTDALRLDDGMIVVVGLGGTVLTSDDGGLTFELHQQKNRRGISAIIDAGGGSLVMVGEFGVKTATLAELTSGSE